MENFNHIYMKSRKYIFLPILFMFLFYKVEATVYEVTAPNGLSVRTEAGSEYTKLGSLAYHEKIESNHISNGWAQITYKGQKGFVSTQYLQEIKTESTSQSEHTWWMITALLGVFICSLLVVVVSSFEPAENFKLALLFGLIFGGTVGLAGWCLSFSEDLWFCQPMVVSWWLAIPNTILVFITVGILVWGVCKLWSYVFSSDVEYNFLGRVVMFIFLVVDGLFFLILFAMLLPDLIELGIYALFTFIAAGVFLFPLIGILTGGFKVNQAQVTQQQKRSRAKRDMQFQTQEHERKQMEICQKRRQGKIP